MVAHNISEHALMQRINRILKNDMRQLKKTHGKRTRRDVGDYYILDYNRNIIKETFVDIEKLGRRLKVLNTNEHLQ